MNDRDVAAHASLEDIPASPQRRYSFYAAMGVHASLERVRAVLTDYRLYAKMISYIDKAEYSPITQVLRLEGGIWKFRLRSDVRFDEKSDRWIHYHIVGGHFRGLSGDMFFEPAGEKGTLVYFNGELRGSDWPPAFVIERGAEIVFGFTAKRMRSYIETVQGEDHGSEVPQPRSHLFW
jgi:hypothetical protein